MVTMVSQGKGVCAFMQSAGTEETICYGLELCIFKVPLQLCFDLFSNWSFRYEYIAFNQNTKPVYVMWRLLTEAHCSD